MVLVFLEDEKGCCAGLWVMQQVMIYCGRKLCIIALPYANQVNNNLQYYIDRCRLFLPLQDKHIILFTASSCQCFLLNER